MQVLEYLTDLLAWSLYWFAIFMVLFEMVPRIAAHNMRRR